MTWCTFAVALGWSVNNSEKVNFILLYSGFDGFIQKWSEHGKFVDECLTKMVGEGKSHLFWKLGSKTNLSWEF